ncbi:hypothetical protein [Legionella quateirensis]|uniref:hypothetical protein n=1 Tax=Legionella quateirensis TaxID=45072 RepID=UPI0007312E63|nr:hypothetical protein [Legionella quateirensis]
MHLKTVSTPAVDDKIRDILLDSDPNEITSTTCKMVIEYGELMVTDATEQFEPGIISDRVYKSVLVSQKTQR